MVIECHNGAQKAMSPIPGKSGQPSVLPNYSGAANLYRESMRGLQWLLERQFPKDFCLARMDLGKGKQPADLATEINNMLIAMDGSVPKVQRETEL